MTELRCNCDVCVFIKGGPKSYLPHVLLICKPKVRFFKSSSAGLKVINYYLRQPNFNKKFQTEQELDRLLCVHPLLLMVYKHVMQHNIAKNDFKAHLKYLLQSKICSALQHVYKVPTPNSRVLATCHEFFFVQ